jgi:hypothetical protein
MSSSKRKRSIPDLSADARDVLAAMDGEVSRCAARLGELGTGLEQIGHEAFGETGDIGRRLAAHELQGRAHRIRGLVTQGVSLLCELQSEAGRLLALATLRGVAGERSDTDE